MKCLLPPLIAAFFVVGCQKKQVKIQSLEPFYLGIQMGISYKLFIHDKERLENGISYKFRTRFESDIRTTISAWRIANCMKSTIDGKTVPALSRSGLERGMPFLIRAVCGDLG